MNKGFLRHVWVHLYADFFFSIKWTYLWLAEYKMQNQGYPGTEPWAGRGCVSSHKGALRLLGVSTSSPRGVQAQLYRFSSAFTICSTNIPLLCQVLLWDPHTALSCHFSPVSSGLWQRLSQPHLCGTLLNLRWTWDIVSRRQGSSLRLRWSRHRSNRKGREGLLMAKRQRMQEAQRMKRKQTYKNPVVTGHHYRSDQWRLSRHQLLFLKIAPGKQAISLLLLNEYLTQLKTRACCSLYRV